jgi:hypothetical protein
MNEPFVPFAKTRSKPGSVGESFRLTILPQAHPAGPALPGPALPAAAGTQPGAQEPQVTLERDGDRITRITIQCACGQILELNCAY